jgi:hypothetical protein
MVTRFDPSTIAKIALDAFRAANYEYAEMSGGVWGLRYPIERYFSVKIAESIWRNNLRSQKSEINTAITLEESVVYLYEQATDQKTTNDWIRRFGSRGNIDIALWVNGDRPFGAIEVKKWGNNGDDIFRICRLLEGNSSIEFGLILFSVDEKHLNVNVNDTLTKLKAAVTNHFSWLSRQAESENIHLSPIDPIYDQPARDFAYGEVEYALGWGAAVIQR